MKETDDKNRGDAKSKDGRKHGTKGGKGGKVNALGEKVGFVMSQLYLC